MSRAILIVLDSVGVGGAPDAAKYEDEGADTIGHIADACADGRADRRGLREGPLALPTLTSLGLGEACRLATGRVPPNLNATQLRGASGCAAEVSTGKDSQSGHWEIAGSPVTFEWGYFPNRDPAFPQELTDQLCRLANLPGILGNRHASGTDILDQLGDEHVRTGKPICYTSTDSVFQVAAHEEHFGRERLYEVCQIARKLVDPLHIGRVIARPFVGSDGRYQRTGHRRDYGVPPPPTTLLHRLQSAQRDVISIGKIGDLFCHHATGYEVKAHSNDAVFDRMLESTQQLADDGFLFVNLVDFDTLYGHRRDTAGYAAALESFDRRLPELERILEPDDLVIVTGDHGCDPTWRGSDHTRECVPIVSFGPAVTPRSLGQQSSFAAISAMVADHLRLS